MAFLRNRTHRLLLILIGLGVVTVISSSIFNYMTRASASNSTFDNPNNQPIADVVIDKVFVDKSERRLQLLSGDDVIRTYRIALGDSPVGHKQQEGDQRTPVGIYTLDYKNENSIAHRSIHISYPNAVDKARAKQLGVSPGGDIMIHGQMNGFGHLAAINQKYDWTDGCIAVTDDEMDEIMAAVTLGIPIEIVE